MDGQAPNGELELASLASLRELVDAMVRDVDGLRQELDELVNDLRYADPEDHVAIITNAVRLEGLTQARTFVVRAQQAAQRANSATGRADHRAATRPTTQPVRSAEPAPVPPGTHPARPMPDSWPEAERGSATDSFALAHRPDLARSAETSGPSVLGGEAQSSFNSNGGALELSVLPPDGEFQRYRIDGPLTFAAMLAFKQAVAKLRGVSSVRVAPRPEGATVLTLVSQDPDATVRDLQNVPGFMMRLAAA